MAIYSKYVELCEKNDLSSKDDAMRFRSNLKGAFAYPTRQMELMHQGKIIIGQKEFTVKMEDLRNVLSSKSYPEGAIVPLGYFTKKKRRGGYNLTFNEIKDFPPEYPCAMNENQLVEFFSRIKDDHGYLIEYLSEANKQNLLSVFFLDHITPIILEVNLSYKHMQEFNALRDEVEFKTMSEAIKEDNTANKILKRAGIK